MAATKQPFKDYSLHTKGFKMTHSEIKDKLQGDLAYIWSIDNYSASNLKLVFRAWGFDYDTNFIFEHLDLYSK